MADQHDHPGRRKASTPSATPCGVVTRQSRGPGHLLCRDRTMSLRCDSSQAHRTELRSHAGVEPRRRRSHEPGWEQRDQPRPSRRAGRVKTVGSQGGQAIRLATTPMRPRSTRTRYPHATGDVRRGRAQGGGPVTSRTSHIRRARFRSQRLAAYLLEGVKIMLGRRGLRRSAGSPSSLVTRRDLSSTDRRSGKIRSRSYC